MVLGWFDTRAAVQFANETSRDIQIAFPLVDERKMDKKQAGKRTKKLERIVAKLKDFSKQNKLNFYKKAKFANTLKWSLKEAGYSDVFIREVTGLVLVNL
jgi:hypothetical protein